MCVASTTSRERTCRTIPSIPAAGMDWEVPGLMKEKIIAFFTDVVKEMKKVTWPKQDDLRDSTIVVLVVCLLIAAFVFVVDTVVSEALKRIL
jgi:preprotein translocase subunit SecE